MHQQKYKPVDVTQFRTQKTRKGISARFEVQLAPNLGFWLGEGTKAPFQTQFEALANAATKIKLIEFSSLQNFDVRSTPGEEIQISRNI